MKRPWFALGVLLIFTLAAAGWFYYLIHIGTEIYYGFDFGSVADAIALAFVAIIVEYLYSKRFSDHKADTDLLLDCLRDAKEAFRALVKQAQDCESGKILSKPQRNALMNAERELSNSVHSLEVALKQCEADFGKLGFAKLKEVRQEIKDALTDTPFPGPYDGISISQIRVTQTRMRDELTRMAFAINKR